MSVPTLAPTVYLRGKGCGDRLWRAVTDAMHARGWVTVKDRTTAWHLARGGVRVILCDFSATYAGGLSNPSVTVGRVRAKYEGADMVLPLISGGEFGRPEKHYPEVRNNIGDLGVWDLDADELAELVASLIVLSPPQR